MKKSLFVCLAAVALLGGCKSKNEKCRDVCDQVKAEENKDGEWLKACQDLCDTATKE
ncbi:MAG: hypothetical protein R3B72_09915 [Polyangiaceae bacterium]